MASRVELFEQIRRDRDREGLSIRELARRHAVHRRAVRQALASPLPPRQPGPSTPTAHSRQFRGWTQVSGASTTGIGFPTPFCLASAPGARAADRRSIVRGAPTLHRTSGIGLPLSFARPSRRPGARPLTPPGHMAPRGALLVLWSWRTEGDPGHRLTLPSLRTDPVQARLRLLRGDPVVHGEGSPCLCRRC